MNILAMLVYGTLVQVYTPPLEAETHFYKCNTDRGVIVDFAEYPDRFKYLVRHKCKLGRNHIDKWYELGQLREIK